MTGVLKRLTEPKIQYEQIFARIPAEVHSRVKRIAKEKKRSVTKVVEAALLALIDEDDREKAKRKRSLQPEIP